VAFLVFSLPLFAGENWPQFRGPNGDGASSERNLPITWSRSKNVAWKTAIPGEGHSSPVVWEDSIFLTSADHGTNERLLLRLDAVSGKVLWKKTVLRSPIERMHRENSAASSTPVTDGTYVFTSFQNGRRVDIQSYDFDGNRIWSVQPLSFAGQHGYSYTPLIAGDLLIFDFAQNDEAAVIALEKKTGKLRWRFDRQRKEISHVTPLLVNSSQGKQVIVCGANEIRSFNPATGASRWWAQGPTDVCVAGLTHGNETVFATGGFPRRSRMAIDLSGRGNVSDTHVKWDLTREATYVPSPVYHQGHLYSVLDEGMLYCFDAAGGQAVWNERLGVRHRASLLLAEGNIYATNDQGLTVVFRATPEGFQEVSRNDLQEFCYATPAISNGRIFIRTDGRLHAISNRK
jgi:outer membrane protein assembly factor BamB